MGEVKKFSFSFITNPFKVLLPGSKIVISFNENLELIINSTGVDVDGCDQSRWSLALNKNDRTITFTLDVGYTIEPGTNCELVVKGKTFDLVQPVKINDPSLQFQLNDGAKQSILRSSGLNKHLFGNVLTANDTSIESKSSLLTYRFRPMNNVSLETWGFFN